MKKEKKKAKRRRKLMKFGGINLVSYDLVVVDNDRGLDFDLKRFDLI